MMFRAEVTRGQNTGSSANTLVGLLWSENAALASLIWPQDHVVARRLPTQAPPRGTASSRSGVRRVSANAHPILYGKALLDKTRLCWN